ncbi:MAG: hypothetical protein KA129_09910, partial [Microthrixaceae bacterium]|nr:hypothetical protein [Microthrixaceae bacterium]
MTAPDQRRADPAVPTVRIVGDGRAGGSFARALAARGWAVDGPIGRGDVVRDAAAGVELVLICVP